MTAFLLLLALCSVQQADEPFDDAPYVETGGDRGFSATRSDVLSPLPVGHLDPPTLASPDPPSEPRRPDGLAFTCPVRGVVDVGTGRILYGRNLTERRHPASTTKVLTTLLALEAIEDGRARLDEVVKVSADAAAVGESGLWLSPGEPITLRDLLIGVMVRSANDAAYAVGERIGGSADGFVALMNQRAQELGCIDSHFVNPHGLHHGLHGEPIGDQHYTTGYDLLLITLECWRHPFFKQLCLMDGETVSWVTVPAPPPEPGKKAKPEPPHANQRIIHNRNKLLSRYNECVGVKTGYTKQAGACLISAARRGRREVLAVTMHSASGLDRWIEGEALLRWGLDEFEQVRLLGAGQTLGQAKVRGGREAEVEVVTTGGLELVRPVAQPDPPVRVQVEPTLRAPLMAGLPVGWVEVDLGQGNRQRIALVAAADVPLAGDGRHLNFGWLLSLTILGLFGYGTIAEAHRRRGDLLPPGRGTTDHRRPGGGQR